MSKSEKKTFQQMVLLSDAQILKHGKSGTVVSVIAFWEGSVKAEAEIINKCQLSSSITCLLRRQVQCDWRA